MSWGAGISLVGRQGNPGLSVITSSGAPTVTGSEGQAAVDTTNGVLYKYTNGAWVSQKSLVGPMGLNGINGSFYAGVGAPTASTYTGPSGGQAVYIQSTGEVWIYTNGSWSDTNESLVGPAGQQGAAGQSVRGSQIYQGSGPPSSDPTSFSPAAQARDMYFDTSSSTYYVFS